MADDSSATNAGTTMKAKRPDPATATILALHRAGRFIDERDGDNRFDMRRIFELLPGTVADLRTLRAAEALNLFRTVNHTVTRVGAARLFFSLLHPAFSLAEVRRRQEAVRELAADGALRRALADFLAICGRHEDALFRLLNVHTNALEAYGDYRRAVAAVGAILAGSRDLPRPESPLLAELVDDITAFGASPLWHLLRGPCYRTPTGVRAREEKGAFTPALPFRPRRLGLGMVLPFLPGLAAGSAWLFGLLEPAVATAFFLGTSWFGVLGLGYGWYLKPFIDFDTAILPVRQRLLESATFGRFVEAVARLDELLSLAARLDDPAHPTVLPEVEDGPAHYFVARELRNPVLSAVDPNCVALDIALEDQRITFLTGPNSGGKTTCCKAIVQNQILAQAGAPVAAAAARIGLADRIVYQAPAFDSLADVEGRFGTELKATRDIFFSATPKTLVILDEIAEGTTTREKIEFSTDIMCGFRLLGATAVLVTHNHEMVAAFQQDGVGDFRCMETVDGAPTHRLVAGISREGNAQRVAAKIGFSRGHILAHLQKVGAVGPEVTDDDPEVLRRLARQ